MPHDVRPARVLLSSSEDAADGRVRESEATGGMTGTLAERAETVASWAPAPAACVGRVVYGGARELLVRTAEGEDLREAVFLRAAADAAPGDEVLVQPLADGRLVVVGVLARGGEATDESSREVRTPGGTTVRVAGERVEVRDARGGLLFEHRADEGRTVVGVPRGDLAFEVPDGAVSLRAAHGVSVQAGGEVTLAGEAGVKASAGGEGGAALSLEGRAAEIRGHRVGITAAHAVVHAERAELVSRAAHAAADALTVVAGVVETRAQRVVERARNVYREVENLAQTRAGRIRLLAREALHASGKQARIAGEEETKVSGGKVYIG